jgi:tetratricopeptide (TPR) repeat protein
MLDTRHGTQQHSHALAEAIRALQEADDLTPAGSQLDADLDLSSVVQSHRTSALKGENLARMTPLVAQQRYLSYAQQQFARACGNLPAGSRALFSLGRLYVEMDRKQTATVKLKIAKAITLYQAALTVDVRNSRAANELGVLLAKSGRLADARHVLQHGVSVGNEPELWSNLSAVHRQLGEQELARLAYQQWQVARAKRSDQDAPSELAPVRWLDASEFAKTRPSIDP